MSTVWVSADAVPPCWIPLTCQSLGRWERFQRWISQHMLEKETDDVMISFELEDNWMTISLYKYIAINNQHRRHSVYRL